MGSEGVPPSRRELQDGTQAGALESEAKEKVYINIFTSKSVSVAAGVFLK